LAIIWQCVPAVRNGLQMPPIDRAPTGDGKTSGSTEAVGVDPTCHMVGVSCPESHINGFERETKKKTSETRIHHLLHNYRPIHYRHMWSLPILRTSSIFRPTPAYDNGPVHVAPPTVGTQHIRRVVLYVHISRPQCTRGPCTACKKQA